MPFGRFALASGSAPGTRETSLKQAGTIVLVPFAIEVLYRTDLTRAGKMPAIPGSPRLRRDGAQTSRPPKRRGYMRFAN